MTKPTGRPRGKPPLPPGAKRDTIVEVHVTQAELAEIDRRREQDAAATGTKPDSRSEWLVTAAGVRRVQHHLPVLHATDAVREHLRAIRVERVFRFDEPKEPKP